MFPLPDKQEKEEKIDPEGVHKVPENRCQTETQMVFNRVKSSGVFVKHTDQNNDACKDVQQVGRGDHVEKRGGHIALRAGCVQARLDELVEAVELVKHKGQSQNQGEPQETNSIWSDPLKAVPAWPKYKAKAAQKIRIVLR